MKNNLEHAWTTATLVATAVLAVALAIAAVFFTHAAADGGAQQPQSSWRQNALAR